MSLHAKCPASLTDARSVGIFCVILLLCHCLPPLLCRFSAESIKNNFTDNKYYSYSNIYCNYII